MFVRIQQQIATVKIISTQKRQLFFDNILELKAK
jgi:hypothetical protein